MQPPCLPVPAAGRKPPVSVWAQHHWPGLPALQEGLQSQVLEGWFLPASAQWHPQQLYVHMTLTHSLNYSTGLTRLTVFISHLLFAYFFFTNAETKKNLLWSWDSWKNMKERNNLQICKHLETPTAFILPAPVHHFTNLNSLIAIFLVFYSRQLCLCFLPSLSRWKKFM